MILFHIRLTGDKNVVEALFRYLLRPEYRLGAVVDGFPRSPIQVNLHLLIYFILYYIFTIYLLFFST